jgi:CheY-like chemotaxis protein
MGGTITVESEVGRGSTFRFTVRFGRSTRSTPSGVVGARASLEGLRVLVVDDNATNRLVLDEWLGGWHMRSESVGDAASAMDALVRAAGRGEPFLLVLLDERLQDTDGTTLASQISNRPGLGDARLILLSSEDSRFDIAHAREVGISACLLKPVQPSQLLETIAAVMNGSTADGTPALDRESMSPKPGPLPPTARLDVLIAEDNELNVVVLQEMLGRRGHRVHVATDGRAALAHAVGGAFDLLLLDVHMPQIDGFEVARAIREYERGTEAYLPIIALTACSLGRDRERCLAAGMDGFLSKPVDPAALWAAISRVLSISPQPGPPGSRLIDSTVILLACGGQAGLLEKLRQGFRRSLPERMAGARAAVRDHDLPHLCQAAHALHGTLAAFSTVAGSTASSLEDAANGGELDRCTALVKDLESMCSELLIETDTLTIDALTSRSPAHQSSSRSPSSSPSS